MRTTSAWSDARDRAANGEEPLAHAAAHPISPLATHSQRPPEAPGCQECPYGRCDFGVPRVRFYLSVWRQAHLARESFASVLRHRTRSSRTIAPGVRGQGFDWEKAHAIGWSLDEIARSQPAGFMHSANAEAVARLLCPERYGEDA